MDKLEQIASVLPDFFTPVKGAKIRVGQLHEKILNRLGLRPTHANLALIRAVTRAMGARRVVIHGKRYYAGIPNTWTYRKPLETRF